MMSDEPHLDAQPVVDGLTLARASISVGAFAALLILLLFALAKAADKLMIGTGS